MSGAPAWCGGKFINLPVVSGKLINLPPQEVERRFDKTILGFTSALARDPDDHHRDKDHDDHFHDRNPSTTPDEPTWKNKRMKNRPKYCGGRFAKVPVFFPASWQTCRHRKLHDDERRSFIDPIPAEWVFVARTKGS